MATDKACEKCREVYERPQLRMIELVAEEVLVVGCKSATTAGKAAPCTALIGPCSGPGS